MTEVYVGLLRKYDVAQNKGEEISGPGYARVKAELGPDGCSVGPVEFPQSTGAWGTITHFALFENDSTRVPLVVGEVALGRAIGAGETVSAQVQVENVLAIEKALHRAPKDIPVIQADTRLRGKADRAKAALAALNSKEEE